MLPRHCKLRNFFSHFKTNLLSVQIIYEYFVPQLRQSIVACVVVTKLRVPSSMMHASLHARRIYIMSMVSECCITKCTNVLRFCGKVTIIIFILDIPSCGINYKIVINYHKRN
jgi:hypothetical protein